MTCADTSFLFSMYLQDVNSAHAIAYAGTLANPILFTSLNRFELRNAIRLAVFRGVIAQAESGRVLQNLSQDLRAGSLERIGLRWRDVLLQAERLSAAHTEQLGNRTIDILHVAAAMTIGATEFLTFDTRQRALAGAVGLRMGP